MAEEEIGSQFTSVPSSLHLYHQQHQRHLQHHVPKKRPRQEQRQPWEDTAVHLSQLNKPTLALRLALDDPPSASFQLPAPVLDPAAVWRNLCVPV
ncbi:hypothetical protein PoB_004865700 [Plakobranchus ocellatus]|uniref:Uncharacterized protein n=1 Tax=Plakobranchus ocellatus TaxID=259542 RepID=A0AAV4BS31_9GAST|nr:hypothetical protein PoB_004865700 [Plakobranchus ocellatus]